jgi:hypothetical protein
VIASTLLTLLLHVQVLPLINTKTEEFQPGAVLYTKPTPDSRFSLSVTHTATSTGVKVGARWKF